MSQTYDRLLERARRLHDLAAASHLLSWDQETNLPPRGVPARARHRAALAAVLHDGICDPELGRMLEELEGADLASFPAANVRELRRQRDRAVRIPRGLVEAITETGSLAQQAWAEARRASDWPRFAPHLEELVELKRREAEAVGYEAEPYDALLDEYEPDTRVADLLPVFAELRRGLVGLLDELRGAGPGPDDGLFRQQFPVPAQETLCRDVLRAMGFDFESGRLDTSLHPFTEGIAVGDVRITTSFDRRNVGKSLYAALHEGGHALYEQGLPAEREGEPAAAAVSLGLHESQSRLWENQVGRSREFLGWLRPRLRELFPEQLGGAETEDLYRAANVVRPGPIRIAADEVTYNLHILLRLDLERGLLQREIAVADLPSLWRERSRDLLGLEPPDDAHGVLQDIHWAFGVFGYFPTYTLGNLYAAQIFEAAASELDDLPGQVAHGELAPLREWLRRRIHGRGAELTAPDLCREVTGRDLTVGPLLDYLRRKYGDIYGLRRA